MDATVSRCQKCEAVLEPTARFCTKCGNPVVEGAARDAPQPPLAQVRPPAPAPPPKQRVSAKKASAADFISHWYTFIEGLQASPQQFYASVEEAIRQCQIANTQMFRIDWPEGGPFSPRREYLRVQRKEHVFDICGAPFANGFFVSWWLGEIPSGCLTVFGELPVLGFFLQWFIRPATYYRIDTGLMFQESIRTAVNKVIDQMTAAKGIRGLSELERKPILREFAKR